MTNQKKTLQQLFVPICLEILFYMLAGTVDTLMLSSVSDKAVGAVGTANTYIGIFTIMFSIISTGIIAVMTQNIGAGRIGIAYQTKQIGIIFTAIIGIFISVFSFFFSNKILEVVGIAEALKENASIYLKIVGGACIFNALIPVFSSYLRVFGYTKQSLYASIISNIVNFVLNAIFLFVFSFGVKGVAVATVISKVVNLIIVVLLGHFLVHAKESPERISNKILIGQILKIGLPSACETALYNLAMTLVIRFLNQMDADGINVTAHSYTTQITNFSFCVGAALAQANAIMTGWYIGAKEYEQCNRQTKKAAMIGVIVAIITETTFTICSIWIIRLFSDNPNMISLVRKLLAIDIIREIGRGTNLVYGNALKTSGDAIFPVIIGVIFMFLCAVGGTYIFGICMELMVIGAYIGLACDECIRAVCMIMRWKSEKWKKKSLVNE